MQRRPDAVAWARTELESLRDRAAEALAFELAGRIQSEIGALTWVTSPQRVTTLDRGDLEVYGWSAGLLVCFGMSNGRLRHWSQRCCCLSRAVPLMAATPPVWTAFAQRNAELAAALAQKSA